MDALPRHGYHQFHGDTLEVVRRGVGLERPGEMADAVRILDNWVKQQNYLLKKDIHPVYLETLIVMSKGSLERAKAVLEKMCTVRTLLPQYFDPYDMEKEYQIIKETSYILTLPKLTEDHHRVIVWRFIGQFPPRIVEGVYRILFSSLDYVKRFDYHQGVSLIYDVSECDLKYILAHCNLIELKNVYMIVLESYAFRIKRIHVITASKIVYTFINFFKQFLKKKIVDRLLVHESHEELHQFFPEDILPKDYGGTERSLDELREDFKSHIMSADYRAYLKDLSAAKVDQALRPPSDDVSCGTFRALAID